MYTIEWGLHASLIRTLIIEWFTVVVCTCALLLILEVLGLDLGSDIGYHDRLLCFPSFRPHKY